MLSFLLLACRPLTSVSLKNTPPSVNIYSHEDGVEFTAGDSVTFIANVVDLEDEVDLLRVSWLYGETEICSDAVLDQNNDVSCTVEIVSEQTTIQVIARDEANELGQDRLSFLVYDNTPPEQASITISPELPTTLDDVSVVASAVDVEENVLQYDYAWSLQNDPSTIVSTTDVLLSTNTTKGQSWQVVVTPFDGVEQGPSSTSSFFIHNSPPAVDAVSIAPSTGVYNDSTLNCLATVSDPDQETDIDSTSFLWLDDGVSLGQGAELLLTPAMIVPGDVLTCQARVVDRDGALASQEAHVTIENRAPIVNDSALSPSMPAVGDILSIFVDASDPDLQTLTIRYDWYVNGAWVSSDETLSGVFSKGDVVDVQVTVDDGDLSSTVSHSTTIQNSIPTAPVLTLNPSGAIVTVDDLSVVASAVDVDGDALQYDYAWSLQSSPLNIISTSNTLSATETIKGQDWQVVVTAFDGTAEGPLTTAFFSVENSPPEIGSILVTPSTGLYNDSTLSCSASVSDPDQATDLSTTVYEWFEGGASLGQGATITLNSTFFSPGDVVSCQVTATDVDGESASLVASRTIENREPTVPVATAYPLEPVAGQDDLICELDSSSEDADGDLLSYSVVWIRNGLLYEEEALTDVLGNDTIPTAMLSVDDEWECQIVASDGFSTVSSTLAVFDTVLGDDGTTDTGDTNPVDTGDTNPVDTGDTDPVDTGDTNSVDTGDTDPVDTGDTNEPTDPEGHGYNLCGLGKTEARAIGDWNEPIVPSYLPMVDENDTLLSAEDNIDYYDCAPSTDESGNEIIYRFETSHSGRFRAKLSDGAGVDIDIHLLQNPQVSNGVATGCIARAHEELEVDNLSAGTYYVIADSWSGLNGAYRLSFEWEADGVWTSVPVTDGITWERKTGNNLYGGTQSINVLRVDPSLDVLEPRKHAGCQTVSSVRAGQNAVAGINGSFFNGSCGPLGMIRYQGTTYHTNTMHNYNSGEFYQMRTIGWTTGGSILFSWLDQFADWTSVSHAIGGYPSLVESGTATYEVYPGQSVWSSTDWSANPRTAIGYTADGEMLLVTVDGRSSMGSGVTSQNMANLMVDLGAVDAIGLDGGGSTTMSVKDCWHNHIVNHPSDNFSSGHDSPRAVSDGVYIWD